jgi:beta-fructofuranosidase
MNIADRITASRSLREKLLADPYRPAYHFTDPEDVGIPGDSNGCFYADGLYHLMYLYNCRADSFRWGHVTSADLIHWRHRPDALVPDDGPTEGGNAADSGIFSGGAFVDDDGTAWLSYWALPREGAGGLRLAYSKDRENGYEKWTKLKDYAVASTEFGLTLRPDGEFTGSADPSNIWKSGGRYYMQAGNLLVLNKFRSDPAAARYHGDWTSLYRSDDLVRWEYLHRFYDRSALETPDPYQPTDGSEDDMCPSFLPLYTKDGRETGKHLQLFISHNKGCQYYIGRLDETGEYYLPEIHGRMTWRDNSYFAPEALVTPDRRQITWVWLNEEWDGNRELENGWSGIFALPRHLWYDEERGCLGMAPAREVRTLRYNETEDVPRGDCYECVLEYSRENAGEGGMTVREEGDEKTVIRCDAEHGELIVDTRASGRTGRRIEERAPLVLDEGEALRLDIFVDRSVVEVYANDRQAIVRHIYPSGRNAGAGILGRPQSVRSWKMAPANPY